MKITKIIIALALALATLLCFAGCDNGGDKSGGDGEVTTRYFIDFHYFTGTGDEVISMTCNVGDILTAPTAPEIAGIKYLNWEFAEGGISVAPGEQFPFTEAIFRKGSEGMDENGKFTEYYASCTLDWQYSSSSIAVHGFDGIVVGNVDWSLEVSAIDFYRDVCQALISGEQIKTGLMPNDLTSLDNLYHNGYKLDGLFCDEAFTTPLTSSTKLDGRVTDIFAKWTYVGLFFKTEDYEDFTTLIQIKVDENIDSVEIPAMCNFKPVTQIKRELVSGNGTIGTLTLPSSIIAIPQDTFVGENVDEVVILGKDTVIAMGAFDGTPSTITLPSDSEKYSFVNGILYDLAAKAIHSVLSVQPSVVVPEGIVSIGTALAGTDIQTLTLPSSVIALDAGALKGCSALCEISLKGVKTIGDEVFDGCTSLEEIIIPSTVSSISEGAFDGCELQYVFYEDGQSRWNTLNAVISGKVFFYSRHEQKISEYLYSRELLWHYDENGEVAFWISVNDNFRGKTVVVTDAKVVSTEWLWSLLSNLKSQGYLDQITDENWKNAIGNAETKADFDSALTALNATAEATIIFGEDGTATIYNEQTPDGYTYNYIEINDRVIFEDPLQAVVTKGEFYVDENGALYEIQQGEKFQGSETMTVTFYYAEN